VVKKRSRCAQWNAYRWNRNQRSPHNRSQGATYADTAPKKTGGEGGRKTKIKNPILSESRLEIHELRRNKMEALAGWGKLKKIGWWVKVPPSDATSGPTNATDKWPKEVHFCCLHREGRGSQRSKTGEGSGTDQRSLKKGGQARKSEDNISEALPYK